MPSKSRNSAPPPVMTWSKAAPVLVAAVLFDALRILFELFWFFGPAIVAVVCTQAVSSSNTFASTLGAIGCTAAAGAAGAAAAAPLAAFGVVMADAVGLFAFLALGVWILVTNGRVVKAVATAPLQFAAAFAVGEIPIIGTLPVFTWILWRLYGTQIRVEKAALAAYEKQAAAELTARRREELQLAQAANDENAAEENAAAEEQENEEQEIPDEMRRAA